MLQPRKVCEKFGLFILLFCYGITQLNLALNLLPIHKHHKHTHTYTHTNAHTYTHRQAVWLGAVGTTAVAAQEECQVVAVAAVV